MLNIEVQFSLATPYQSSFVSLQQRAYTVAFQLKDGTHVAQSESVDLGVVPGVGGRRLLGQFSFEYTYEPERHVVTVNGTEFNSARSMCLTTVPEGTAEFCRQRAAGGGFTDEDLKRNPHWNYTTPLTPGLQDVFAGLVRAVNDRLIEALQKVPGLTVQVREHPPQLPADDHQKFRLVYRDGQFRGVHDPSRELAAGEEVVNVESVYGGHVTLNAGQNFANVIFSTHDPKIDGLHWIQLWEREFGAAGSCTSFKYQNFPCTQFLVGGHVINGTQAQEVPYGSNSVWILPICKKHNANDGFYMAAITNVNGIWLKNYMGT